MGFEAADGHAVVPDRSPDGSERMRNDAIPIPQRGHDSSITGKDGGGSEGADTHAFPQGTSDSKRRDDFQNTGNSFNEKSTAKVYLPALSVD